MEREPKIVRVLFNDDMARAIVQGRKTATRRPPRHSIRQSTNFPGQWEASDNRDLWWNLSTDQLLAKFAPCAPGDILIGRECWAHLAQDPEVEYVGDLPHGGTVEYRADHNPPLRKPGGWEDAEPGDPEMVHWRPSIHMPDWAARIRRRVVSVTVERVQDITEEDAVREGFEAVPVHGKWVTGGRDTHWSARKPFAETWDSIYAAKGLGWDVNPWVWRIEFERKNVPEVSK